MHIIFRKEQVNETLSQKPTQGKHMLEPLKSFAQKTGFPVGILEDSQVSNDAEVHKKEGDLWYCLEGEVEFTCGGELVDAYMREEKNGARNPNELKAKEIRGGETFILNSGDWLWIPPETPHQHRCSGTARLIIIKIPK